MKWECVPWNQISGWRLLPLLLILPPFSSYLYQYENVGHLEFHMKFPFKAIFSCSSFMALLCYCIRSLFRSRLLFIFTTYVSFCRFVSIVYASVLCRTKMVEFSRREDTHTGWLILYKVLRGRRGWVVGSMGFRPFSLVCSTFTLTLTTISIILCMHTYTPTNWHHLHYYSTQVSVSVESNKCEFMSTRTRARESVLRKTNKTREKKYHVSKTYDGKLPRCIHKDYVSIHIYGTQT